MTWHLLFLPPAVVVIYYALLFIGYVADRVAVGR